MCFRITKVMSRAVALKQSPPFALFVVKKVRLIGRAGWLAGTIGPNIGRKLFGAPLWNEAERASDGDAVRDGRAEE